MGSSHGQEPTVGTYRHTSRTGSRGVSGGAIGARKGRRYWDLDSLVFLLAHGRAESGAVGAVQGTEPVRDEAQAQPSASSGNPEMANDAGDNLANGEVLRLLRQIEEHLAALRYGARNAASTWLTIAEVAEELRLSRDTIERLIAAGKLRAAEVRTSAGRGARRRYRVRREWVDAFLADSISPLQRSVRKARRARELRPGIDFIG